MRIGIDAHIVLPEHKRFDQRIAQYTEDLMTHMIDSDKNQEHTWVLFFDNRMKDTKKFERKNVEIKHFPFVQYRQYLPVFYSHMLIASFLRSAKLDVFHSPEGLIPFGYMGNIVTTFHYVPKGKTESNLFVRSVMMGARAAFAQLCRRAKRIIVSKKSDRKILTDIHGYPKERVVVMEESSLDKVDWKKRGAQLMDVYEEVAVKRGAKGKEAAKKQQVAKKSGSRKGSGKKSKTARGKRSRKAKK